MNKRIRHPKERIGQQQNELNQLKRRLAHSIQRTLSEQKLVTTNLFHRLENNSPTRRITQEKQQLNEINTRLTRALSNTLSNKQTAFARIIEKLNLVSPLNTLSRGYAIASKDKQVIRSVEEVKKGDPIHVRVQDGEIHCVVADTSSS